MAFGALTSLVRQAQSQRLSIRYPWVLYYGQAVAMALVAIHKADIIHRDVKPDNILIGRGGVAKITDFGIARDNRPNSEPLTQVGHTVGTPGYMAPEQVGGMACPQSDIFSLGVTLYALLTGALPAQEQHKGFPIGKIEEGAWSWLPRPFVGVIKKMTHPNLGERYPDAAAVVEALSSIQFDADNRSRLPLSELPPLPSGIFIGNDASAGGAIRGRGGRDTEGPHSPGEPTENDGLGAGAGSPAATLLVTSSGEQAPPTKSKGRAPLTWERAIQLALISCLALPLLSALLIASFGLPPATGSWDLPMALALPAWFVGTPVSAAMGLWYYRGQPWYRRKRPFIGWRLFSALLFVLWSSCWMVTLLMHM